MKKFVISVFFILVCLYGSVAATENFSIQEASTETCYPVVLTDSWKNMERSQRVAACRLSNEEISEMDTSKLITTILQNPFMIDLYAFDSFEQGFEHLRNEFPEVAALESRMDLGQSLIEVYKEIPVVTNKDDANQILNLSFMEILIAQPEMTDNLSEADLNTIVEIATDKYYEKLDYLPINRGSCNTFFNAVSDAPESNLALAASPPVKTPNGNPVPVIDESNVQDWTAAEIFSLNNKWSAAYPTAVKLRNPTKKYNCHSYAWYSTSASNYYWMNDPSLYMSDGSYTNTSSTSFGNKIYWKSGTTPIYSGILAAYVNGGPYFSCTSKWGNLGLYNHLVNDCPYSGTKTYWKR